MFFAIWILGIPVYGNSNTLSVVATTLDDGSAETQLPWPGWSRVTP